MTGCDHRRAVLDVGSPNACNGSGAAERKFDPDDCSQPQADTSE
jgi:hypothetical protein